MYPVRLSFESVLRRIEKLLANGHAAEALVTSVFTFEKLVKRCLRRSIVARGFTLRQAEILLDRAQFDTLTRIWEVFECDHKRLPAILGRYWQDIPDAKSMRNDFVHGNAVYDLDDCSEYANEVLKALKKLHEYGLATFGHDPWTKRPQEKIGLRWKP
jgi:hypothetical protein